MWHLYFIYSLSTDKFYIGISEDPWQRLVDHNSELNRKHTAHGRPWHFAAIWQIADSERDAIRIERFLKKQKSRKLIERMIKGEPLHGVLGSLVRVPQLRD